MLPCERRARAAASASCLCLPSYLLPAPGALLGWLQRPLKGYEKEDGGCKSAVRYFNACGEHTHGLCVLVCVCAARACRASRPPPRCWAHPPHSPHQGCLDRARAAGMPTVRPCVPPGRCTLLAGMAKSAERRRVEALDVTQGLAFSLVIIGVSQTLSLLLLRSAGPACAVLLECWSCRRTGAVQRSSHAWPACSCSTPSRCPPSHPHCRPFSWASPPPATSWAQVPGSDTGPAPGAAVARLPSPPPLDSRRPPAPGGPTASHPPLPPTRCSGGNEVCRHLRASRGQGQCLLSGCAAAAPRSGLHLCPLLGESDGARCLCGLARTTNL